MEGEAVWGNTGDDSQLLALYGPLLPGVQGIFQGLALFCVDMELVLKAKGCLRGS